MFGGGNKSLFSTPTSTTTGTSGTGLFNLGNLAGSGSTPQSGGGSLFGTPTQAAPATGASITPGFFGSAGAGATSAPTTPSIFGNAPATGSTPALGSNLSLFGKSPNTATTSAPVTNNLFGSTPTAPGGAPTAPAATTSAPSLFSNTAPTTTTAPSLFGSNPAPSSGTGTAGTASGLFPATQPKPSLFNTSTSAATTTPSLFGISNTNAQTTASTAQSNQPGQSGLQSAVKVELYNLAPYHKFHELNDAIKSEVEGAEKYILSEIQKCEALSALFPEHREMVQSVRSDAELMERRLMTANSFLQSDSAALESLINHQKQDDQHASLSVRTLDLLRQPNASRLIQAQQQASAAGGANTPGAGMNLSISTNALTVPGQQNTDTFGPLPTLSSTNTSELDITSNAGMITYFNRHGAEMEARLKQFLESVSEVEASLRSVEIQAARKSASRGIGFDGTGVGTGGVDGFGERGKSNAVESRQDEARRLNRALREFYAAMSDTAARLVDAQEGLRLVKEKEGRVGGGLGRSVRR